MKFLDLQQRLNQRTDEGLLRERPVVQSAQKNELLVDGKSLINFSGNDYLGLANSETARQSVKENVELYGFGSGASHLICGHQQPHETLENELAAFMERDAALTFSSGYMANLAIIQCLSARGDVIIADKLNHASLIDGVKLSQATSRRYSHCDLTALERRLKNAPQNKFVVTDSVFSMDGDIAPLTEIVALCERYNAILIVDDAHGFGVLGETGKGCIEHFGLNQKQLPVLMCTLGKSLGSYGAFISGEQVLVDYLIQFARSYIYTTAMPAMIAAASLENLKFLIHHPEINHRLKDNIQYFKSCCKQVKVFPMPSITAIQPVIIGDNKKLLRVNKQLKEAGILVAAIRPPTVAENSGRLRITLNAAHSRNDIKRLVDTLATAISSS